MTAHFELLAEEKHLRLEVESPVTFPTEVDAEKGTPAIRPHEFEGFFSELEVFGLSTFREWELLGKAAARGSIVHAQQELFGETGTDEEVA